MMKMMSAKNGQATNQKQKEQQQQQQQNKQQQQQNPQSVVEQTVKDIVKK